MSEYKPRKKVKPYTVEKGVPMPEPRGRHSIYPFGSMEIGDSFVTDKNINQISTACATYAQYQKKRKKEVPKYACRTLTDGELKGHVRVWRIK